ncbi:Cell division protein FtsK [Lutibaculum baratangense AMV1]|uniref:Cell division protein FtsK n=1 Tax=Lutibaculum baratangense AMV1 TaxID=631454 RepID=V4R147_9HYPH|nr:Cell division protein FtsK [Lutibaculum baratangense AMV1]
MGTGATPPDLAVELTAASPSDEPQWFSAFSLPTKARFTRTPDVLRNGRGERADTAPSNETEAVAEPLPASESATSGEAAPVAAAAVEAEAQTTEAPAPAPFAHLARLIRIGLDEPPAPVPEQDNSYVLDPRLARFHAPEEPQEAAAPAPVAQPSPERAGTHEERREPGLLGALPWGDIQTSYSWSGMMMAAVPQPLPAPASEAATPVGGSDGTPAPAEPSQGVTSSQSEAEASPAANEAPVRSEPEATPEPHEVAAREAAPPVPAEPPAQAATVAPEQSLVARYEPVWEYEFPSLDLLSLPPEAEPRFEHSEDYLVQMSDKLQQTLKDFGVRGEIIDANPGPVVTLYEMEPAPGLKLTKVINVSSDIARSMSAVSARVSVIEGRNIIGIELPNRERETVWLRELLADEGFATSKTKLGLCLGKTIGGQPLIADLARMPHLLIAGTTGSGKSVAVNAMILSLLYRRTPEECRLIMIDPKMLELSVYEGIPHLLTPVVTDPHKAVTALKWAVREMEDRYRKMAHLGVRNLDGFNARVAEAREKGEVIRRQVQTGFNKETGQPEHAEIEMDLAALPHIVVIVDEMADLMMVAGKEIEGAIQRLAQMARAAGIHLIMATQRPSVDVITGTIKANFPTRISFQVTSKIDSRTILGEQGAEELLGAGDMLYMVGGGRITRVHGPFVSDQEVEKVVEHLKRQGRPTYLEEVTDETADDGDDDSAPAGPGEDAAVFDSGSFGEESADLYEQAIRVVLRDQKASTSYIQRRLQIGYNRAASLMERMEEEGVVGPANHAGKRQILMDEGSRS